MKIIETRRGGRRAAAALLLAALSASVPAAAQEPARTITFEQALRIALSQNSSLLVAENATELQAITVRQQKLAFLPNLQFNTSGNESVGRGFSQDEGRIMTTSTQSFNAGVSSSMTLFNGFRNVASLKSAELSQDASELSLARTRQTVALAVAADYIALVAAAEQLRVRRDALASEESVVQQIQVFVDAGSRPIADLYQQQAGAASARAALVEGERTLERARTDVLETLQLDPTAEYEFVPPALETVTGTGPAPLAELITRAVANRVDVAAQEAKLAAAAQTVRAASAARWPSISLGAGYNTGATSASTLGFTDQLDERRGGSVSLSVSLPIFDRLSTRAATEQASIALDNASIELDAQRRQVGLEVRRAWVDYQAAAAQVAAAEAQLRAADLALTAVTERYRLGAATLVELTQARTIQVQAASALVSGRYTLVLQRALIAYYTGDLDPDGVVIE